MISFVLKLMQILILCYSLILMQVGTNGYFSFDKVFTDYVPFEYPGDYRVTLVSPFFADIDISKGKGNIRYEIHTISQSPALFEDVDHIINMQMNTTFAGRWLLLAEWKNVPEFGRSLYIVSFQGYTNSVIDG